MLRGWMDPRARLDVLEKKNLLLPPRRTPAHPARDPVTIPTELSPALSTVADWKARW